jgi:thiol-disulfide isomerase/thioredoxin
MLGESFDARRKFMIERRAMMAGLFAVSGQAAWSQAVPPTPPPARPTLITETIEGQGFDLSSHLGSWVIVNVWATWCAPCIPEMQAITQYIRQNRNCRAIGLTDENLTVEQVRTFAKRHKVDYPLSIVGADTRMSVIRTVERQRVRRRPLTFIVNPQGELVFTRFVTTRIADFERMIGRVSPS